MIRFEAKTWSRIFDFLIIAGDFFIGSLLARHFIPYMEDNVHIGRGAGQIFCAIALLVCVLYVVGLWINRVNFRAEKTIAIGGWDGIALAFNSVLLASLFIVVITTVFPAMMLMWLVIILVFGFMIGWFWLHWHILQKVSSENSGTAILSRKIIGFFMVIPFVLMVMLPVNSLAEMLRFGSETRLTFQTAVISPLSIGLLLALVAWFMFYIPRKFLKGFTGSNISSRAFFVGLVVEYALKLSPLNLI